MLKAFAVGRSQRCAIQLDFLSHGHVERDIAAIFIELAFQIEDEARRSPAGIWPGERITSGTCFPVSVDWSLPPRTRSPLRCERVRRLVPF
ncbi:hypothetical protein [Aurantiacibacter suaedae]|uniref:hypothetical protein n=1 Tax=Aurantiacibacter suaedae TaxID=2545755 RepID=UPI0010F91D07|nr:hypothetical protein [Aurantiacibacter suaedae]